tara:strand:+ start:551 stop:865 length:315 start_codon:yes stop_codon:yes gene_type:complete
MISITLNDLNKWGSASLDCTSSKYDSVTDFIKVMEDFPPRGVQRLARPLIIDEGVNPDDLYFQVTDANGNTYHYKPELGPCFKSTYESVKIDPEIAESINNVLS